MSNEKSENHITNPPAPAAPSRRVWSIAVLAGLGGLAVGGAAVWAVLGRPAEAPAPAAKSGSGATAEAPPAKKKPLYQCPMHPTITSDHPSNCPICGMKLVLVEQPAEAAPAVAPEAGGHAAHGGAAPAGRVEGLAPVTIDPARQQMIGLKTAPATRGPVSSAWRTVGRVEVDPTRVRRVNVKVEGFAERVFADFVGKTVRRGQPLFSIYSPNLLAAQNELLLALDTQKRLGDAGALAGNGHDLVAAARRKLELWDIPAAEIEKLERTGQPTKALTLVSPISGVVTVKNIVEGARVTPGDSPYEITDLGMVWVMADAYETDLGRVKVGMPATMTLKPYPGRTFKGRVQFIDPLLDPKTRTTKVHLHFPNPTGELKPQMYGEVLLEGRERTALTIPADAVLHAGTRNIVFVALEGGKFVPREVRLGTQGGGTAEVLEGLSEGEQVVTRANFLIDSESRLRASLAAIAGK